MQLIYFKWVTENYFFFVPEGRSETREETKPLVCMSILLTLKRDP